MKDATKDSAISIGDDYEIFKPFLVGDDAARMCERLDEMLKRKVIQPSVDYVDGKGLHDFDDEDSGTDVTISKIDLFADTTYGPEGPVYLDGKLVCTNAAYDVIRKHVLDEVKEHLDGADVETMEALDDLA